MRKILYFIIGLGILSLYSCADKSTQLALEKYVKDENDKLPKHVDQFTIYDSIVCDARTKTVTMYYLVERDYVADNLKNRDEELVKQLTIGYMRKQPQLSFFLTLLEESNYSLVELNYKKNGEEVNRIVYNPDEYSRLGNPEQMEKIIKEQMENDCKTAKAMCPLTINENTIMKDVSLDYNNKQLVYFHELRGINDSEKETWKAYMRLKAKKVVDGPSLRIYKDANMTIIYRYVLENDTMEVVFTPNDYNK